MVEKVDVEKRVEAAKAMTTMISEGVRMLVLINGGAVAGILAGFDRLRIFVDPKALKFSIVSFVVGLFFVSLVPVCFWAGNALRELGDIDTGRDKHWRYFAVALSLYWLSVVGFALGAACAIFGIA